MDIFTQSSSLTPKSNFPETNRVGPQQANAPKIEESSDASKNDSAKEINDVVSISKEAANIVDKNLGKSEGSFEINNNRINYSLTENNEVVIQIIDKKSDKVIKQIPPEEMVKIKEMIAKAVEQKLEV